MEYSTLICPQVFNSAIDTCITKSSVTVLPGMITPAVSMLGRQPLLRGHDLQWVQNCSPPLPFFFEMNLHLKMFYSPSSTPWPRSHSCLLCKSSTVSTINHSLAPNLASQIQLLDPFLMSWVFSTWSIPCSCHQIPYP